MVNTWSVALDDDDDEMGEMKTKTSFTEKDGLA